MLAVALPLLVLAGCAARGPAESSPSERPAEEPLALQMLRTESQLKQYPFFTLLSFERPSDAVFVRATGASPAISDALSHTGQASLQIPPGTKSIAVRLDALHSGRAWPDRWTLLGVYVYSERPVRLTASYELAGKALASYPIELPAAQWTPVMLDIAAVLDGTSPPDAGALRLALPAPLAEPLWIDDVIEMDNATVHVADPDFSVRERGFHYAVESSSRMFKVMLKTPEAAGQGWVLQEANPIRARFASRDGKKSMTIYASGRRIVDGEASSLDTRRREAFQRQAASPAQITVGPALGRLLRNTPGDEDNDGYNEREGVYRVAADGPRIEMMITPRTPQLLFPVIQIEGLPAGTLLATMEGRLLDRTVRLADGSVLVELPGTLDRPTMLNVRLQQ